MSGSSKDRVVSTYQAAFSTARSFQYWRIPAVVRFPIHP
jgi:hypothetical protein